MPKLSIKPVKITSAYELSALSAKDQKFAVANLLQECAIALKQNPSEVIGLNFKDFLKSSFGTSNSSHIMRILDTLGGFRSIQAAFFPKTITPTMIERVEVIETSRLNRKYENREMYDEYFLDRFKQIVETSFKRNPIKPIKYKEPKTLKKTADQVRELNVVLGDLHLQSLIKKAETGSEYGATEEARRLAFIGQQVASYKKDHRKFTTLNVMLLGDIIQNQLHDLRDGSPLTQQFMAAVYLLTQLFCYWAAHFKKVSVYCSVGNHGRNTARHKNRASFEKWDSIESMIYYALKSSLANAAPNVTMVIPQTPWIDYTTFNHHIYATHGDTAFNPGNPGKTVDVQKLEVQVNKINAVRIAKNQPPFKIFVAGHIHRAMAVYLDSGQTVFTNAPLCPADGFANSIGIYATQCGQWMWESTKNHAIGDKRFIVIDSSVDEDAKLDLIVRPYTQFAELSPSLK